MDLHLDDVAKLLFWENPGFRPIHLNLRSVLETPKDLFYFLLDLFCKGIVMTCNGSEEGSVSLESMTQENIVQVARCLVCIGVVPHVHITRFVVEDQVGHTGIKETLVNLPQLEAMADDLDLQAYMFRLVCPGEPPVQYEVSFELIRV